MLTAEDVREDMLSYGRSRKLSLVTACCLLAKGCDEDCKTRANLVCGHGSEWKNYVSETQDRVGSLAQNTVLDG